MRVRFGLCTTSTDNPTRSVQSPEVELRGSDVTAWFLPECNPGIRLPQETPWGRWLNHIYAFDIAYMLFEGVAGYIKLSVELQLSERHDDSPRSLNGITDLAF